MNLLVFSLSLSLSLSLRKALVAGLETYHYVHSTGRSFDQASCGYSRGCSNSGE